MFGLLDKPLDKISGANLIDLVEVRKVREHLQLDYKEKSYKHNHSGTVEMLADITSMANAQGGFILIGVEEDDSQPDGTPKALFGIENGDEEANRIQSICISSIDEKISGLRVRDIRLSNGRTCIVIHIPNSIRKPHMVVHEKHRSFRIRHGREKSFMGTQELRNMIINMSTYRSSLATFITERKGTLPRNEYWLMLLVTPIYVDTDKIDPLREDICDLLTKAPGLIDPRFFHGIDVGIPKPRIYGVEAGYPETSPHQSYSRMLRLFRNGHLEFRDDYSSDVPENWPNKPLPIYSYRVAVTLLHFLGVASRVMLLGEIAEPISITLFLNNINHSYLHHSKGQPSSLDGLYIWEDNNLTIDIMVNDLMDPIYIARIMIDRLFNAFGYRDNLHFDEDNKFIRR